VSWDANGERMQIDAPARVKNYVEAGTAESDICAINDVSTVLEGDAGDIAAL
jgi:hypothetical protein